MLQIKRHAKLALINCSSCLLVMSTAYGFMSEPDIEKTPPYRPLVMYKVRIFLSGNRIGTEELELVLTMTPLNRNHSYFLIWNCEHYVTFEY